MMSDVAVPLISHVRSALLDENGRGVVVAVSGGSDSVGLLRLLNDARKDLRLSVAHLDHGTRGDAGRADASFVADLAESLGLPFDLGHWSPLRAGHFEADARKARYAWLVEIARKRGAALVAIGHTRDDQAETILHRVLRGTGLRGLAGIPSRRELADGVTLIRPLLEASRAEVRAYLATIGQTFRDDASNADLCRTRNRIRHDLLPKLAAEYNPNVVEALARLGRIAQGVEGLLDLHRDAALVSADALAIVLRCEPLRPLSLSIRAEVIRSAWHRAAWPEQSMTADHWIGLARAVDRIESRFSTAYGIDVGNAAGLLRLTRERADRESPASPMPLTLPGQIVWNTIPIEAVLDGPETPETGREVIDFDQLDPFETEDGRPVLMVRAPQDGDRLDPLGLDGRTQALNDFFRGRGVSKADRATVPLVVDRRGIAWVVGHRIAHRVRVTSATRRRLLLRQTIGPPVASPLAGIGLYKSWRIC